MADVNGKKRKRPGEPAEGKKNKRVVIDAPSETVTVSSVMRPKHCLPVIASTSGLQVATNTLFHSYVPKEKSGKKSKRSSDQEFLLHSQQHQSLDYTAREDETPGSNSHLNHYVGVYDPKTGKLQVIEAKKMVLRGSVRAKQASAEAMGQRDVAKTMLDMKTDLGQTFGTKKAKKVLQDNILNAISPQKKTGEATTKIDKAGRAILESVGSMTSAMATREELQAVVDGAKPIPRANIDATDVEDVYDPHALIGADILKLVPIREWQEKVRHKEGVQTASRFVALRVNALASSDDTVDRLRVLRYFSFVLLFYLHSKPGKMKGTRSVPPREKLKELLDPAPESVVENIRRKFSDAGVMRKFHIDLLMTHCCVYACLVDNFEVDTQNLRDDLRVDPKTMNQYFHEIGARVKQVSNKAEGTLAHIARLAIPLNFPKQRHMAPKRK